MARCSRSSVGAPCELERPGGRRPDRQTMIMARSIGHSGIKERAKSEESKLKKLHTRNAMAIPFLYSCIATTDLLNVMFPIFLLSYSTPSSSCSYMKWWRRWW